jgi:hypothetical protein
MARLRLLVSLLPLGVGSIFLIGRQPMHPVAGQDAVQGGSGDGNPMTAARTHRQ